MGINTRYEATITKTCDGCGESWTAKQSFSTTSALLSFGGPIEASGWKILLTDESARLMCEKCVEHAHGNRSE